MKNNIGFESGTLYLRDSDEGIPVHEGSCEVEYAYDAKTLKAMTTKEVTFEFKLEPSPDWVLVNCTHCRQPLPVTQLYAAVFGKDFWRCPRCAAIIRDRR